MEGGLSKLITGGTVEGATTSWQEGKKSYKYLALCNTISYIGSAPATHLYCCLCPMLVNLKDQKVPYHFLHRL